MEIELLEIESLKSSVSIPESVRSETKSKFDALLKNALKKTSKRRSGVTEFSKSSERLIDDDNDETQGRDNEGYSGSTKPPKKEAELSTSSEESEAEAKVESNKSSERLIPDEEAFPVPKPRKSKKSNAHIVSAASFESDGTYDLTSPKIIHRVEAANKEDDAATYTKSPASALERIGDILVHSNVASPIIAVVERKSPVEENEQDDDSSILVVETHGNKEEQEITHTISYESETKTPKPKKRTRKEAAGEEIKPVTEETQQPSKYNFENITAVTVHKTDRLPLNSLVTHPLVSVHIIDIETGEYLKKSDKNRAVTFYYENKKFDYISPVLTQAYNLRSERSFIPQWEETLIFNEDFNYIVNKETARTIIFFEIVDFLTLSEANHRKDKESGWHHIAWSFLKPIGADGSQNFGKKVRLQLYKPGSYTKKNIQMCSAFLWWRKGKLVKYSASLHVTVKGIPIPQGVAATMRSKIPVVAEVGSKICDGEKEVKNAMRKVKWKKTEHQSCKLPSKCLTELETCVEGSFVVKFCNSGKFLAVAVVLNDVYTIRVFETENWETICYIPAHQGLIYNITWSGDDEIVLSASADCTVSLWDFTKNSLIQMLPHPSFVYTCAISHRNEIATGCYDKIVRIWAQNSKYVLQQELQKHEGYLTCIVFGTKGGEKLYSADSCGIILEWERIIGERREDWSLRREIRLADLRATTINQILLCKREKKLIIHARDSALRIVDLDTTSVLHWLRGAANKRVHTKCSLSPCGIFATCGSENGSVCVWNTYTGKCVATYSPCGPETNNFPIHDVQFHPKRDLIAFAHYGSNVPIFIYGCAESPQDSTDAVPKTCISNKSAQPKEKLDFHGILCKIDEIIHRKIH